MKCFRHKLSDERGLQARLDGDRTKPLPRRPLPHLPGPGWGGGPPSVDHTVPATSCCSNNSTGKGRSGPAVSLRSPEDVPAQLSVWTPCAACRAPRLRLACQSRLAWSTFSVQGQSKTTRAVQAPCPLGSLREGRLRVPHALCLEKHWQNGPGDCGTVAPSTTSAYTDDPSRAPPFPYSKSPAIPHEHPSVLAAQTFSLTSNLYLPSHEMRPRL